LNLTSGSNFMHYDAYYSDPHLGHFNIIKYCNRPFTDRDHMVEEMVRRYNEVVSPRDSVLWLGDCFFLGVEEAAAIMDRLNGKKWLLRGNHDKRISDHDFLWLGFEEVYTSHFVSTLDHIPVRYSHYPYVGYSADKRYPERRPPKESNVVLIHGHTHEPDRLTKAGTVHVGVDAWGYGPAPRNEVLALIEEAYEAWV
jgi:calcineurin-like phosphoesterase family protein